MACLLLNYVYIKFKKNKMATTSKSENGTRKQTGKTVQEKPGAAQGLRDLFEDELKDIYWAEKALTKALPKMIKMPHPMNWQPL